MRLPQVQRNVQPSGPKRWSPGGDAGRIPARGSHNGEASQGSGLW